MNRSIRSVDDFFLHPPWGLLVLTSLFLLLGVSILLRCSELGGEETVRACRAALVIAAAAAFMGLLPVLKSWGGSGFQVLLGVFIGAAVRLVIGLGGVAGMFYFTSISPVRLIVFFGLSYGLFLLAETGVTIWLLKTVVWGSREADDERVLEHVWYADRVH